MPRARLIIQTLSTELLRQRFAEFHQVVDAGGVHDEAAAGAEAVVGGFGDARDFAAGAGDEDAVGVGQAVEGFGGSAEDGVHVRDAEAFGVLLDEAVVFGVHFDRVDLRRRGPFGRLRC